MKDQILEGQVSLFDVIAAANNAVRAFCIATNESVPVRQPNARQREMVPRAEYVVNIGGHAFVLQKTSLKKTEVPEGYRFYHYQVEDSVYSGIFVDA